MFFMKYTWLVLYYKNLDLLLNLLFYYKYLLCHNFHLISISWNLTFLSSLYFFMAFNKHKTIFAKDRLYAVKFATLKVNNLFLTKKTFHKINHFRDSYETKIVIFAKTKTFERILNLFLLMNSTTVDTTFKPHFNFRVLNLLKLKNNSLVFEPTSFFKKWHHIYLFLYNLFYFNQFPLIYGSPFCRKEILALNWSLNFFDFTTWKHTATVFTLKAPVYSQKYLLFFKRFLNCKISSVCITDIQFHFRTLHYLRKYNFFTMAFIPVGIDPWSVSFAFPILQDNFFMQLFFFKFFFLIRKHAMREKFILYKKLWVQYQLNLFKC